MWEASPETGFKEKKREKERGAPSALQKEAAGQVGGVVKHWVTTGTYKRKLDNLGVGGSQLKGGGGKKTPDKPQLWKN